MDFVLEYLEQRLDVVVCIGIQHLLECLLHLAEMLANLSELLLQFGSSVGKIISGHKKNLPQHQAGNFSSLLCRPKSVHQGPDRPPPRQRLWVVVATTVLIAATLLVTGAPATTAFTIAGPRTPPPSALMVVAAAKAQIGVTVVYDPSYVRLAYPGGDVAIDRGVCTDVLIRAYRAIGIDLQVEVHIDMVKHFANYPRTGLRKPDSNIDHRRVRNLATYFTRRGAAVPQTLDPADYLAGDIVMWDVGGLAHTGLVADTTEPGTSRHLIVHNIGDGAQMEDILFAFPMTGHFRYPA